MGNFDTPNRHFATNWLARGGKRKLLKVLLVSRLCPGEGPALADKRPELLNSCSVLEMLSLEEKAQIGEIVLRREAELCKGGSESRPEFCNGITLGLSVPNAPRGDVTDSRAKKNADQVTNVNCSRDGNAHGLFSFFLQLVFDVSCFIAFWNLLAYMDRKNFPAWLWRLY